MRCCTSPTRPPCLEQHSPVDREPAPIEGLDLVCHRDVGVQIRVTGPVVPMGERGRDQAADVDLPEAPGPVRVNNTCPSMNFNASRTAA